MTSMTGATSAPGDFKSDLKPIWCPGCGDFGVVQAIYRALAAVGRPPHEIVFVSGIGCSSRIPGYTTAYGFTSVHGRAIPIAQGLLASGMSPGAAGTAMASRSAAVTCRTPSVATSTSRTS